MWPVAVAWTLLVLVVEGTAQSVSSDCGGQLFQQSGSITSPQYPNNYPNNKRCQWYVTGSDDEVIDLRFVSLDLEGVQSDRVDYTTCPDNVTIFDGNTINSPLITTMCRVQNSSELSANIIRSSQSKMLVVFISDATGQRPGFVANFWAHKCPAFTYGNEQCNQTCNCVRDKTSYCNNTNGVCVCKPGWTGPDCSQDVDECANRTVETCPNNYQECVNTVGSFICQCKAGLRTNSQGNCEVDPSFQCAAGHGCSNICVKVQGQQQCYCPDNMKLVGNVCQTCTSLTFGQDCRLNCNSCNIRNTASCNNATGGCVCNQGWTSTYCNQDINECQQLQVNVCPDTNQVCINTAGGYQCGNKSNHVTLTNSSGTIRSPGYSNGSVLYSWTIVAQNPRSTIAFQLRLMYSPMVGFFEGTECSYTAMQVYDGSSAAATLLAEYCGNQEDYRKVEPVLSSSSTMYIVYQSKHIWPYNNVNIQYYGTYSVSDSRVFVSKLAAPSGNIVSPGYPVTHSYNVSFWSITPDSFTFMNLIFHDFGGRLDNCSENYLKVYDGSYYSNETSWTFCGANTTEVRKITTTYRGLSLLYHSGYGSKQRGFNASYISCDCYSRGTESCLYQGGPCVCKSGFTDSRCYSDIDECLSNPCPAHSQCINYWGYFKCICWNGTVVNTSDICDDALILTNKTGGFNSPNYPQSYPSYVNMSWTLIGQQNTVVSLRFLDFTLGDCSKCNCGGVDVYDGGSINSGLIGQYCGYKVPSLLRSTSNKMVVLFHTTASFLYKGFNATYFSHVCPLFKYGEDECSLTCPCNYDSTRTCDNINGVCFCQPGWGGRGCSQDVDECRNSTACPSNSDCINEPGTYRCECRPGYQNVSGQCQALSTCTKLKCSHLCGINGTTGKEQCYCPADMEISSDGVNCLVVLYPYGTAAADQVVSGKTKTKLGNISMSDPIYFSSDVPVGTNVQNVSYVLYNGVVVFSEGPLPANPDLKQVHIGQKDLLASLWRENINGVGTVYYHLYESCNSTVFSETYGQSTSSPKAKEVTDRARRDVQNFYAISDFKFSMILVATYKDVQAKGCTGTNTFQLVFVSGRVPEQYKSYQQAEEISLVFFIYHNGDSICPPGQPLDVGISTNSGAQSQMFSSSSQTKSKSFNYQGVLTYQVGSTLTASHLCQRYLCNHSDLISSPYFQNEVNQLFQCPCSMDKLSLQWQLVNEDKSTRCYSISAVAKSRFFPNNQRNILCCYKWTAPKTNSAADQLKAWQAGSFIPPAYYLISDPWQASSVSSSLNPFAYRDAQENMQAQIWCCKKSSQKYCNRFYKTFLSVQCTPSPAFLYASALGDPTIQTLDGRSYPFNGVGEFIMLTFTNFMLQGRTSRIEVNGTLSKGSVFTAFAAKESNYSAFQVQLATTNTTMVISANGMDFTNKFNSDVNFELTNQFISVKRITENNKVVAAVSFPCGVGVKIHVGNKSLEIEFEVHKSLQNQTRGLLGNFNNNSQDDFVLPNGTKLPNNMTDRQIFEKFAKSYQVTSNNSVFVYNKGETTNDYQNAGFVPIFLDELSATQLAAAKTVCGSNDTACLIDYATTGSADIARNTRATKSVFDIKLQKLANRSPTIQLTQVLSKNTWQITEGLKSFLQFQAKDDDKDLFTYELVENMTGVLMYQNGTLSYTPSLSPVSIGVRVKDAKDAYSPVLQIIIVVCPICKNNGQCTANVTDTEYLEGAYIIPKCACLPAYTGSRCETELDACSLHPCSQGQNCTDLTAAQQGSSLVGYKCGPCPNGTVDINGSCEDINECLNKTLCEQACQNTYGSYSCLCRTGFRLNNVDRRSCIDINECEERSSTCQQQCINTPGNYSCACYNGYILANDGRGCILNASYAAICQKCQQICTVNINQASCACNNGFKINETDPTKCIDIDECNSGAKSPCSQKCVNTVGRFNCSCYPGYKLADDGVTCVECESPKYGENCSSTCNCLGRGVCDKVRGCVCDPRWTGTNCDKDVNECANSSACPDGLVCQNEPGSFRCVCQDGYKLENGACTDINECTDYKNRCDLKVEVCVNNVGNYSCQCKEGYTRDSLTNLCQDINECQQQTDGCNQICENGPGSYRCVCYQGYRLAVDQRTCEKYKTVCSLTCSHGCTLDDKGQPTCFCLRGYSKVGNISCQDINECASSDNLCSQKDLCQNVEGNYKCSCPAGYGLQNNNRTCVACSGGTWGIACNKSCSCGKGTIGCDAVTGCVCKPGYTGERCTDIIDRCATGEVTCQTNEECVVSGGNSVCQCRKGFVWSGGLCQDDNECQDPKLNNCDQSCTNTVGSYSCSCYSGYALNASTNTCQDINECAQGNNCSQTCINTEGSYRCSCQTGQFLQPDGVSCGACANGCTRTCNCVEANTGSCNTTSGQCVCKSGWTSDNCSVDLDECLTNPCPDYRRCRNLNGSFECVCWNGQQVNANGTCKDCNRTLTDQTGYFMTSNYPQFYDSNSYCSWKILSNMSDANIVLNIQDIKTEGCPYDFVTIYDGPTNQSPVIRQVCDNFLGPYKSKGNSMLVEFTSDSSVADRGFFASFAAILPCKYTNCSHTCQVVSSNPWTEKCTCPEWMKIDPANNKKCIITNDCDSIITETQGFIVSSNYPELYPLSFNCHWTIIAGGNMRITIIFSDFKVEATDGCTYDSVGVYDGSSASSPLLGTFCGENLPPNITSTASSMYIEFKSDESVPDYGFKGQYVIQG